MQPTAEGKERWRGAQKKPTDVLACHSSLAISCLRVSKSRRLTFTIGRGIAARSRSRAEAEGWVLNFCECKIAGYGHHLGDTPSVTMCHLAASGTAAAAASMAACTHVAGFCIKSDSDS